MLRLPRCKGSTNENYIEVPPNSNKTGLCKSRTLPTTPAGEDVGIK